MLMDGKVDYYVSLSECERAGIETCSSESSATC